MDVCKEFSNLSSSVTAAGPECGQEQSLPSELCQTKNDGNILLQLLEFKTHLLEVVGELHIQRDAEARFEEQISTLVLEKQELEWEKESLQHQVETWKNQHAESLSKANKQFQAKIRNIEEEKSRYQVSAELKDKEIYNLKEELKSLQLLKYNLEKKSSELEQKLALQSRSKDSHLNQLGELEKRFNALSRQCAMVKQAHEILEQNVDESMKLNKKLTSTYDKQENIIKFLNKQVEELRNKLVKVKMPSVNHDKTTDNPTIKEQNIEHLHQKLIMENEMNRKLQDENKSLRAEKHEVLRSLQLAHQLLSNQTHTVSQLEQNIQTQIEQYQSLEQDHKAIQEKEKAVEEKIKQLMEEYTVSKTCWDKEKAEFLNRMKNEQQELVTVNEAYEELHKKHIELSSKAKEQAQQINELKMERKDQILRVSAPFSSALDMGNSGDRVLVETISKSELSNSVQTSLLAKGSDSPKDTVSTIAVGGQAASTINDDSQSKILKSNLVNCQPYNSLSKLDSCLSATVFSQNMNKYINSFTINADDPDAVSTSVPAESAESVLVNDNDHLNSPVTSSNENGSANTSVKLNRENTETSTEMKNDDHVNGVKICNYTDKEKKGENKEKYEEENAKEKVAGEIENSLIENKGENINKQNENGGTDDDDAMDTKKPDTETSTEEEREPQTMGAKTYTKKVITEKESHSLDSKEPESVHSGLCTPLMNEKVDLAPPIQEIKKQEVLPQRLVCESNTEVQYTSPAVESLPNLSCHDLEENVEMVSEESTTTELPETLNKSSLCHSQTDAAQLDHVSVQGIIKTQTQVVSPPDTLGHMKDTDDKSAKECSPGSEIVEDPTCLHSQEEIPEQMSSLTDSVATACKMSNNLTNVSETNKAELVDILDKSNLKSKHSGDIIDNAENVESQDEFGSCQRQLKITTQNIMSSKNESVLKTNYITKSPMSGISECQEQPVANETKMIDEFAVPIKTTYRSSFEWGTAQRRVPSYTANMSPQDGFFTTFQMSQPNTSGFIGHTSSTLPMFLKGKHNKAPLAITRATDLLNASSVCGTAASSRRLQSGEWRAIGDAHRETEAQTESGVPLSDASFLISGTVGRPLVQTGFIRTLSPDASRSPESDWDLNCSQDTEDQQSSFRAQISKIEQFLNTERLRLPKRRKTEN